MFIPVIVWNAANGWNSARHVAYIGGANIQEAAILANIAAGIVVEEVGIIPVTKEKLVAADY